MDKEEARFILKCFRPDGADADHKDFAEALRMAAADRDLGEWLASERATDAEFSNRLGELELPEGLREEILAGLAAERGDYPDKDELDTAMISALAVLSPPASLRSEMLVAMERTRSAESPRGHVSWWKFGVLLAAAAGVALAFVVPQVLSRGDGPVEGVAQAVPISNVQQAALAALTSPGFSLDLRRPDHEELFRYIRSQGRACPSGCIPSGLTGVPSIGCRTIDVDGKPGAIICFRRDKDHVVHLVVFRGSDVSGDKPLGEAPELEQMGTWAVARWREKGRVFFLMGDTDKERLNDLF